MAAEQIIRLACFTGVLTVVAIWEVIAPRRPLSDSKGRRWFTNLSLVVIDTSATRLIFPVFPVGLAIMAQRQGWGVLNSSILPVQLNEGVKTEQA